MLMFAETVKSWPLGIGGCGAFDGEGWSRECSAAANPSVSGGFGVTLDMIFNSLSDAAHTSPTKRRGGSCTQVSRTGELKKPAHPKVPYAQPPSNAGWNTCLTEACATSITSERLNPITDGQ